MKTILGLIFPVAIVLCLAFAAFAQDAVQDTVEEITQDIQAAGDTDARITVLTERIGLLDREVSLLQEKKETLLLHKKYALQLEEVDKVMVKVKDELGVMKAELSGLEEKKRSAMAAAEEAISAASLEEMPGLVPVTDEAGVSPEPAPAAADELASE